MSRHAWTVRPARSVALTAGVLVVVGLLVVLVDRNAGPLEREGPPVTGTATDGAFRRPGEPFSPVGDWQERDWPDACLLAAAPGGRAEHHSEAPLLSRESDPGPARRCTWTLPDGRPAALEVLLVSESADNAWTGFQFDVGLHRDVTGVGEQAFLAEHEASEGLWVCQGRTIFLVSGDAGDVPRDALFTIGRTAVSRLRGTPAGIPLS